MPFFRFYGLFIMSQVVVAALYHFTSLDDYKEMRDPLLRFMKDRDIRGTLLLAKEGINGTVAGSQQSIEQLLERLNSDKRLSGFSYKLSYDDEMPFYRTRVKLKKEIVTMGVEGIDPRHIVGTYVKPKDWNALISDPDVLLIDTRNDYEYQIGSFENAINPETDSFREFPAYIRENYSPKKHKKVAMFCTGGIRCEKSTAFLKEEGFEEVYHLEGGILKYLEEVAEQDTMWKGECFVFDNRVSVNHSLEKGGYDQCHACRMPITEEDKEDHRYQKGVSCHFCFDKTSETQRQRFQEREKQMQLAIKRGESHIGGDMEAIIHRRKSEKKQLKEAQKKRA